jgi:predicted patatin/cPLA2 family phospholipase
MLEHCKDAPMSALGLDPHSSSMAEEVWDVNHPVLALLRQRRDEASVPGQRTDNATLGLAVEGGGMRGVVSASMLTALDDLGFTNAIDSIYATSSGAINSSYFLAGNTWYPLTIYFEDLITKKFVNPWNILKNKSVLNLDYTFDEVLKDIKPLDYEYVINSPVKLHVLITLVDRMETLVAEQFSSVEDLREALHASSWLPVALKGTTTFRGERAIDGGVLTSLPYRAALSDSCTHILSLSTHPVGAVKGDISPLNRYTQRHLNKLRRGLGDAYIKALGQKYEDQQVFASARISHGGQEPFILDVAPLPGTPDVKRHELSAYKLMEGARSAYEVMYAALEGRQSSSIREGLLRAVPRFGMTERDSDDRRFIQLVNYESRTSIPWGIARSRTKERK